MDTVTANRPTEVERVGDGADDTGPRVREPDLDDLDLDAGAFRRVLEGEEQGAIAQVEYDDPLSRRELHRDIGARRSAPPQPLARLAAGRWRSAPYRDRVQHARGSCRRVGDQRDRPVRGVDVAA